MLQALLISLVVMHVYLQDTLTGPEDIQAQSTNRIESHELCWIASCAALMILV